MDNKFKNTLIAGNGNAFSDPITEQAPTITTDNVDETTVQTQISDTVDHGSDDVSDANGNESPDKLSQNNVDEGKTKDIKMDGEPATFPDGAVRYTKTGKGRFDLIPHEFIDSLIKGVNRFYESIDESTVLNRNNIQEHMLHAAYAGDYAFAVALLLIFDPKYSNTNQDSVDNTEPLTITLSNLLMCMNYMIKELAEYYEICATKYPPDNWKKGIPVQSFRDSGLRHLTKYLMHETDENHRIAFVWNMAGALYCKYYNIDKTDMRPQQN